MESGAEPRDRILEGDHISSSHDGVIREISSTNPTMSPGGSTRPTEKKREHYPSRSSIVPTSHHRPSHSSSSAALDLQSVAGKSSSSISTMTVPIRLDALSYLLNSAVMGNYRMPSQTPYCPPAYPMYPYPQMGCSPYGMCMGPQYCSSAFQNQYPAYQTGTVPCGSQQSMQACQLQVPNFNQCASGTSQIQNNAGVNPQTGMAFNSTGMACNPTAMAFNSAGMPFNSTGMAFNPTATAFNPTATAFNPTATAFNPTATAFNPTATAFNPTATAFNPTATAFNSTATAFNSAGTSSAQNSSGTAQSESSSWANKTQTAGSNERFGSNRSSNSFTSENEKQSSPRRGFGRFGDKKNEDSWTGRQQYNSFGRDFGRGRGSSGSSWRGNSRGQDKEWTFGDRSRNADFGNKRRFGGSPEKFQDRGSFSKRGRWPGGIGGESSDSWQQKNRQKDSPMWSSTADTSNSFSMEVEAKTAATSNAGDEDWETDYPAETTPSKSDGTSEKTVAQSPVPSSPKNSCETLHASSQGLEASEGLDAGPEAEEPQTDSIPEEGTATMEPMEAKAKEQEDSTLHQNNSAEKDQENDQIYIVTVCGEDQKELLVEVNGQDL